MLTLAVHSSQMLQSDAYCPLLLLLLLFDACHWQRCYEGMTIHCYLPAMLTSVVNRVLRANAAWYKRNKQTTVRAHGTHSLQDQLWSLPSITTSPVLSQHLTKLRFGRAACLMSLGNIGASLGACAEALDVKVNASLRHVVSLRGLDMLSYHVVACIRTPFAEKHVDDQNVPTYRRSCKRA